MKDVQARAMLELQAAANAMFDPQWLTVKHPYMRAIVIEGAEAIEHHGWKWWKAQKLNLPQLQMELVDIWHFGLSSALIESQGDVSQAAGSMMQSLAEGQSISFDGKTYNIGQMELVPLLELTIGLAVARRFSVKLFGTLLQASGMSWDELYRQYVSKNVLNFFRQDHGDKKGTYVKVWQGREDNEHLVEIMAEVDIQSPDIRNTIYQALKTRYTAAVQA